MINCPDKWVVVKVSKVSEEQDRTYKVFACWNGSYIDGVSWQLNSGITSVTDKGAAYEFAGYSGSIYRCNKTRYGLHSYGSSVLDKLVKDAAEAGVVVETLDEDTDFLKLKYEYV